MSHLPDLSGAPQRRPDLDAAMYAESALWPYEFYSWPYVCPTCAHTSTVNCGVSRNATPKEKRECFAR